MKIFKIYIATIFAILFSSLCLADANHDCICDKTIFAYHFNMLSTYKMFQEQLKKGFAKKDPKTLDTIKELKEEIKQIPILYSYSTLSDEEFVDLIENWDTNGFFVPTGSVLASISNDGNYFLKVEAKIDTDFIFDKIISNLPSDTVKKQNNHDGSTNIELQTANINLTKDPNGTIKVNIASESFNITTNGIYINKISNSEKAPNKSWNAFINNISDKDCFMYTEADVKQTYSLLQTKFLINQLLSSDIINYISNTSRFRFIAQKRNSILMLAFNDEESRKNILNLYNSNRYIIQPLLETNIGKTNFIDKAPWIGLQSDYQPEYVSSLGFISLSKIILQFLNGILLDSYANSPEMHKKICESTTSQLTLAIEMYNLDHEEQITTIENEAKAKEVIKKLLDEKYLSLVIECPTTGKYDFISNGDLSNTGYITCKNHESPFSKFSEEELEDLKYNFVIQRRACEILICHLNIKKLSQDIEEYNKNNKDAITHIYQDKSEEVLRKLYKNKSQYPICPATKHSSYFSNGDLTEGYQLECEVHGLPETDELEQVINDEVE